jgi:hypothetical protein
MAARTGDLPNNLRRMQIALRTIQYPADVDLRECVLLARVFVYD